MSTPLSNRYSSRRNQPDVRGRIGGLNHRKLKRGLFRIATINESLVGSFSPAELQTVARWLEHVQTLGDTDE